MKTSSPCLICNTDQCPVRRGSSVPCFGAVSFTLRSWVSILFKEAALVWDVFIINEVYYSSQITFQLKNAYFSFENNKAPWSFLGYTGHYIHEYHCQHSLFNNYYNNLLVILPTNPQNSSCIGTVCCTNRIYMIISDMDACHRQWVTITQNRLCSTPSHPQTRTVHASKRVGFSEGNLVHIQMSGWERGGEGECIGFSVSREKRGGVEGHPQRPSQCGSVSKWARGGVSSFPKPIIALVSSLNFSLQVSTSVFL